MLKVTVDIDDNLTKWNKFWNRVHKAGGHVDVGLFGQDDAELPLIGAVQEFGNPDNRYYNTPDGSPAPIIPRPFLSYTYELHFQDMVDFIDKQLERYIKGYIKYETVFELAGQRFQKHVQREMSRSGNWEPNTELTKKLKGSSKPLFHTGTMWEMITYLVNQRFDEIAVNF